MLQLYNSLTNKKETFTPINDKKVLLYVCGITPYDTTHLGHAFTYMIFDVLQRYLHFSGYTVKYAQNVTDIDDDILKKAKEVKKDWKELGNYWTERFLKDLDYLHIQSPTHYVKATDSLSTIIKIIQQLERESIAYNRHGTLYFDVQKFLPYGKLSKYSFEDMLLLLKERGGNPDDPEKKYPLDFILWQPSRDDEPFWKSPWGNGRPGWHIECSAMNFDYLGEQIDIHGGGADLIYPHHESEIAQSETFTRKKPFTKHWMHIAMVRYQGEKMSKSLGNLIMISNLQEQYSSNAVRYTLLSHHYRETWEFQESELAEAQKTVESIEKNIRLFRNLPPAPHDNHYMKQFIEFMNDDINTPAVLKLLTTLQKRKEAIDATQALHTIFTQLGFQ